MAHDEATIVVNGVQLTSAQSATVRSAIESFSMSLADDNALGDDEHGRRMRKVYLERIDEIRTALYR